MTRYELVKAILEGLLKAVCDEDDTKLGNIYCELTGCAVGEYNGNFHHLDDYGNWVD